MLQGEIFVSKCFVIQSMCASPQKVTQPKVLPKSSIDVSMNFNLINPLLPHDDDQAIHFNR